MLFNDGIEFFSKVECFKDGDYYKLRFYPSEKLEQVVSIPYWMTRKGMNNCPFYAFYKGKKVTSSSASTGSFNFLPSVSSGARTSLELGISGYSFSEEENPLYKWYTSRRWGRTTLEFTRHGANWQIQRCSYCYPENKDFIKLQDFLT